MSKLLMGFILGTVLMAGIAYAQNMWQGTDSTGNHTTVFQTVPGIYQWNDSRGHTGTIYQQPIPQDPQYRSPC
jgi:uncharacterized protein YgiB involved in biofilm formation